MNRKTWDKGAVIKDASSYSTISEWRKYSPSAYANRGMQTYAKTLAKIVTLFGQDY